MDRKVVAQTREYLADQSLISRTAQDIVEKIEEAKVHAVLELVGSIGIDVKEEMKDWQCISSNMLQNIQVILNAKGYILVSEHDKGKETIKLYKEERSVELNWQIQLDEPLFTIQGRDSND